MFAILFKTSPLFQDTTIKALLYFEKHQHHCYCIFFYLWIMTHSDIQTVPWDTSEMKNAIIKYSKNILTCLYYQFGAFFFF